MAILVKIIIMLYGLSGVAAGIMDYRERQAKSVLLFALAGVIIAFAPLIPDFITARAILILGLVAVAALAFWNGTNAKQVHLGHHVTRLIVTLALIAAFTAWH
ncbi:hypothetical protein [Lacticaseibacillus zhaodongensis]|uniref:hypothetical protein n=1 Tax=Lacticaseibacillus zhaodongensis TaxID=2668065 RepID=UPI0012D2D925|nr:hypothetical protein [Lacticaseibacillus zhaodongensis]